MTTDETMVGVVVLAVAAMRASSVAFAGFGLDGLIEIGASTVVLWELSGTGQARQHRALRLIGAMFVALAVYLFVQSTIALAVEHHADRSPAGMIWTALTAAAMFTLAAAKTRTGRALDNPVLITEGRVTLIDGILAAAVLAGISLSAVIGWWWADPAAGLVIVWLCHGRAAVAVTTAPTGHDQLARCAAARPTWSDSFDGWPVTGTSPVAYGCVFGSYSPT